MNLPVNLISISWKEGNVQRIMTKQNEKKHSPPAK